MQTYPPGTRIGQYEIASHPMMDVNDDRAVAIKTFRSKFLPDRAARDRFLREGTAWVRVGKHPNLMITILNEPS